MGVGGSAPRPGRFSILQEAGWAPGPVWTGEENLAPTGIQSPDRPARSQSLYRLSYRTLSYNYEKEYLHVYITGGTMSLCRTVLLIITRFNN